MRNRKGTGDIHGVNRIDALFAESRGRRALLVAYLTAGYPDAGTSARLLHAAAEGGADIIELGVPFSDPIADGPVIQHASKVALERGMTYNGACALAHEWRARWPRPALVMFGAANPFAVRGEARAAAMAADAGADGILAADLPVEEAGPMREACRERGLHLVSLVAPTTPTERMRRIARESSGFLYCIARRGITGTHATAPVESTREYIARVRGATDLPLALGFGISTPHAAAEAAAAGADAVVVGTALISEVDRATAAGEDPAEAVRRMVAALAQPLSRELPK